MKRLASWKILITIGLIAFALSCAPKRTQTQFAKNKEAEAGQTYTPEQLRMALGADRYDALVTGIGQDNLNTLAYGIGVSNMGKLLNSILSPGKIVALMSDGPNSKKLNAIEVLSFLNKLDDACQSSPNFLPHGDDTIVKMARMVDGVSLAGMEGIKNIIHGVQLPSSGLDKFGGVYSTDPVARVAMLVALLDELQPTSIMAQLINYVAAPGGTFSAQGTAKLIRMVSETRDIWNLYTIIDKTNSVPNITDVMLGLTGGFYCDKYGYQSEALCTANLGASAWHNSNCTAGSGSNWPYTTKAACNAAGGTWTSDGVENMTQTLNQLNAVCSNVSFNNAKDCRSNSASTVWSTTAEKVPVIVDSISNVPNMYTIVNGLTNDGNPYVSGTPDGVDTMVATINNIWNVTDGDANAYGIKGVKRLAYLVNQLDPNPLYGNDSDFENGGYCTNTTYETQAACVAGGSTWNPAGSCSLTKFTTSSTCTGGGGTWTPATYNCASGTFDNRLNWAFTDEGSASAPFNGKAFGTTNAFAQGGSCSLTNDNTAAVPSTITQSAEQIFNLTTSGAITFYTKTDTLQAGDQLRVFINDVLQATYTSASGANFQLRTTASMPFGSSPTVPGVYRLRFDVQRIYGSTGKVYIDTVTLPGTKGAGRTAAEKTYLMMNNLYLASSITNVAEMINGVSIPSVGNACWNNAPITCAPANDNGLDTLIYIVNRSEYPTLITATPRLATTVNLIDNLTEMVAILNGFNASGIIAQSQLVSMMDHVQTPDNIPNLVNSLGAGGGAKTATIIKNLTAAGTSSMLRAMADFIAGGPVGSGAKVSDLATMINGANTTSHIGTILTELSLSGNIFLGKTTSSASLIANGTGLVSWTAHGYTEGSAIQFSTTGTLPLPFLSGVTYYMKNVGTNSFNLSATRYGAVIPATSAGSGTHTAYASGEIYYPSPTGGVKLAQFMNQVNKVASAQSQVCNPTPATSNASQFCLKNHMIRLLNDIAGSAAGPAQIADIVSGMRPDSGPNSLGNSAAFTAPTPTCTVAGCTGVERMVGVMFDVKTMNAGTCVVNGNVNIGYSNATKCTLANTPGYCSIGTYPDSASCTRPSVGGSWTNATTVVWTPPAANAQYNNPLLNTTLDSAGRLTAMIGDMGSNGGSNTARMVNEVEAIYESILDSGAPRVSYLLNNTNRMRYLSRMLSEMTSADLFVQLLNNSALQISKISTLVNLEGDGTYGVAVMGTADPSPKYGAVPSGYGCTATDCDTNTADKLGRTIQMVNNITQIPNTVTLLVNTQDITYITYLINNATRIHYMTDIVNRLTNVDLLVKILNGADACSMYVPGQNDVTDTSATCTAIPAGSGGPGVWFGVGKCKTNPALTTVAACGAANWEGADRAKLMALVNGMGNSELKGNVGTGDLIGAGTNTKAIGDEFVLADTVNQLGYNGATPRSIGQQMRVVRVINAAQYCGLKPQYDKRIQSGPVCVNNNSLTAPDTAIVPQYQFEEACVAAGFWWKAKWNNGGTSNWVPAATMFNTCPNASYAQPTAGPQSPGVYYANGDRYDGRNRLVTMMLGVLDGSAFSVVVGDVQNTLKTINMVNGVRRIRTLSQFVKWVPGPVTAALVNNTDPAAIMRSLVYLANNLEDDEDTTAKAFASMVHFGVRIVPQGKEGAAPTCLEFTGLGPRRLAAVMNLEAGPYLEGLVSNLGWNMATAAMNCGWGRDANENTGSCSAEDDNGLNGGTNSPNQGKGGMYKNIGSSYVGTPKPAAAAQCVRPRELTAGYRYGNYSWGTNQGVIQANCMSLMPESSGLSICDSVTDSMIWNGFSSVDDGIGDDGCAGTTCDDMWSTLKGTGGGIVGSLMNSTSSYVGFPPPRVYSDSENSTTGIRGGGTTICTDASGNNGDNWQCVRVGLQSGDLRPNDTGNGYYWGTYCAAGTSQNVAGITGSAGTQTLARNCISNDGSWHTEKNYQGPSCNLDPSLGVKLGP